MNPGLLATAVLFVFFSGIATGAEQAQTGGPRVACKADVERLCAGIQPGGGRIAGCLKQNEAQLSAACKDAIAKSREKRTPAAPQG